MSTLKFYFRNIRPLHKSLFNRIFFKRLVENKNFNSRINIITLRFTKDPSETDNILQYPLQ